jgi:hypothetical protein
MATAAATASAGCANTEKVESPSPLLRTNVPPAATTSRLIIASWRATAFDIGSASRSQSDTESTMSVNTNERGDQPSVLVGTATLSQPAPTPGARHPNAAQRHTHTEPRHRTSSCRPLISAQIDASVWTDRQPPPYRTTARAHAVEPRGSVSAPRSVRSVRGAARCEITDSVRFSPLDPPFHQPVFVFTHHRWSISMRGGAAFHFVDDGIEAALERALEVADGNDVRGEGATTMQQYLRVGLTDDTHLAIVPPASAATSGCSTTSTAARTATNASSSSAHRPSRTPARRQRRGRRPLAPPTGPRPRRAGSRTCRG